MKKFAALVCAVFMAAAVCAEQVSFEEVCARLARHPNTTGNFSQEKTISAAGKKRVLKSSGEFIFSLDGILWKTLKPFTSSLAVGMTSVIQTAPDGTRTVTDTSSNQVFASVASTLVSIFSGDASKLHEGFAVEFQADGGEWRASLAPKDKTVAAVMKSIALGGRCDEGSARFDTIVLTEESGETVSYSFTNQKYPEELSADEKSNFSAKR